MQIPAKAARTKRIMASGVFDLLHPGHIYFLEMAKALGDELVVVVARDEVVRRTKGEPLFNEQNRRQMVASLACVDHALIPDEIAAHRYYKTVLEIDPDIIALGYDQSFVEDALERELSKYGWYGAIVRVARSPFTLVSSSQLKERVRLTNRSFSE